MTFLFLDCVKKQRFLADSLVLVVVVFVQNLESSEKCKLQGHIQQTSKKLQKQRAAVSGLLQISPKTTHTKLNALKRELKGERLAGPAFKL